MNMAAITAVSQDPQPHHETPDVSISHLLGQTFHGSFAFTTPEVLLCSSVQHVCLEKCGIWYDHLLYLFSAFHNVILSGTRQLHWAARGLVLLEAETVKEHVSSGSESKTEWPPSLCAPGRALDPSVPTVSLAEAGCSLFCSCRFLRMRTEEVPSKARAVLKVGRDPKLSLCLRIMWPNLSSVVWNLGILI